MRRIFYLIAIFGFFGTIGCRHIAGVNDCCCLPPYQPFCCPAEAQCVTHPGPMGYNAAGGAVVGSPAQGTAAPENIIPAPKGNTPEPMKQLPKGTSTPTQLPGNLGL